MSEAELTGGTDYSGLSPHATKMLRALKNANGGLVSQEDFAKAVYPDPAKRPANSDVVCREIIRQLRVKGHNIENKRSKGYRLLTPDQ